MNKLYQLILTVLVTTSIFSCVKGGRSGPSNSLNLPPVGGQENPNFIYSKAQSLI